MHSAYHKLLCQDHVCLAFPWCNTVLRVRAPQDVVSDYTIAQVDCISAKASILQQAVTLRQALQHQVAVAWTESNKAVSVRYVGFHTLDASQATSSSVWQIMLHSMASTSYAHTADIWGWARARNSLLLPRSAVHVLHHACSQNT